MADIVGHGGGVGAAGGGGGGWGTHPRGHSGKENMFCLILNYSLFICRLLILSFLPVASALHQNMFLRDKIFGLSLTK